MKKVRKRKMRRIFNKKNLKFIKVKPTKTYFLKSIVISGVGFHKRDFH